jgi:hypothetical protein
MSKEIKADEKKQHFDDIYVEETPVAYKIRILDALEYISDNFNREMFDAHILPWAQAQGKQLKFLDLCSCFGNTTMATIYGMNYEQICENWSTEERCMTIQAERRLDTKITGVDISAPACAYGKKVGLYDETVVTNLNNRQSEDFRKAVESMKAADILLCTAGLVYLELETIEELIGAFGSNPGEGYILVNFLNPFDLDKADNTKRILLKHLEFVGSRATRHRRLSPLEQTNFPGEEWALLELWVLKRRT